MGFVEIFLEDSSHQGLDIWDAWSFFKLLDEDGGGEVEIEDSGIFIFFFILLVHGLQLRYCKTQVPSLGSANIHYTIIDLDSSPRY